MQKRLIITILFIGAIFQLQAQFVSNHSNGMDHVHYSMESIHEDVIMAGTVFPAGSLSNSDIHVQRMDVNGNLIWEIFHDIGSDERCLDMKLQDNEYILLTGSNIVDGKYRIFVMRLRQSDGTLVDMTYLYHGSDSPYVEQFGLDIIHSGMTDQYYLVGWGSESPISIGTLGTNEIGLLICLKSDLSFNWAKEIGASTTQPHFRSELRCITEIPGFGIVVNGNSHASFTPGVSGALCFDYSGNLIWNTSHTASRPPILNGNVNLWQTKGALYDPVNDKYYYTELHEVIGSYLVEVSDASTPGAYISRMADYTDLERTHKIVANLEYIDIDYAENTLMLAGNSFGRIGQVAKQEHLNTFIQVDLASLNAVFVNVHEANNPGSKYHDTLFNSPWAIYPKTYNRFTNWEDGYGVLNYDYSSSGGNNVYNFTVTKTNQLGQNLECEEEYEIETYFPTFNLSGTPAITAREYDYLPYESDVYIEPHDQYFGCPEPLPCDISISGISRTNIACYEYSHTVNVTAGSGTFIYQYDWSWGDGNSTTTSSANATHNYGAQPDSCGYTVCVTVKAVGPNGQLCQQTFCMYMLMVNILVPGCGSCGPPSPAKMMQNSDHALAFYPNPSQEKITFAGFDQEFEVSILDLNGKLVASKPMDNQFVFDVSGLASGTYFIFARDKSGHSLRDKLVIAQ